MVVMSLNSKTSMMRFLASTAVLIIFSTSACSASDITRKAQSNTLSIVPQSENRTCLSHLEPYYPVRMDHLRFGNVHFRPWSSSILSRSPLPLRISGGSPGNESLARYLAYIYTSKASCTGTFVARDLVITTAHCLQGYTEGYRLRLKFGVVTSGSSFENVIYNFSKIMIHPLYKSRNKSLIEYDIAWIRVWGPYNYSTMKDEPLNVSTMKVSAIDSLPEYTAVRSAGYGRLGSDEFSYNFLKTLHVVDLPVYPFKECQQRWQKLGHDYKSDSLICAGYEEGECGPCEGDEGGPLFHYDENDNPVLLGVLSSTIGCDSKYPSVYVRTSAYLNDFLPRDLNVSNSTNFKVLSKDEARSGFGNGGVTTRTIIIIVCSIVGAIGLSLMLIILGCFIRRRRRVSREKRKIKKAVPPLPAAADIGPILPADGSKIDLDPPDTPSPRPVSKRSHTTPSEDQSIPIVEVQRVDTSMPPPGSGVRDYRDSFIQSPYPEVLPSFRDDGTPDDKSTLQLDTDEVRVPSVPCPTRAQQHPSISEIPAMLSEDPYSELMSSEYRG